MIIYWGDFKILNHLEIHAVACLCWARTLWPSGCGSDVVTPTIWMWNHQVWSHCGGFCLKRVGLWSSLFQLLFQRIQSPLEHNNKSWIPINTKSFQIVIVHLAQNHHNPTQNVWIPTNVPIFSYIFYVKLRIGHPVSSPTPLIAWHRLQGAMCEGCNGSLAPILGDKKPGWAYANFKKKHPIRK